MQRQPISNSISNTGLFGLRKRAIAGAVAALLASFAPFAQGQDQAAASPQGATDQALSAAVDGEESGFGARGRNRVYSVINMGPEANAAALLNERGQAAFGAFTYAGPAHGFFDGDRIHPIGTLGGNFTWVNGLNRNGVVVGQSEDGEEHSNILGFTWTRDRGMRALAGTSVSSAESINDRNHVVGMTPSPSFSPRAVRWNPNGSITPLGQLPLSLSTAEVINSHGFATGYADVPDGSIHAMLWDRNGYATDLGTLGGNVALGLHLNERNEVAGEASTVGNDGLSGFFWSRNSGMVPINVEGGGVRLVAGLNNRGQVAGDTIVGDRSLAYLWSLSRGAIPLPAGSAIRSDVFDINNNTEMVGMIQRPLPDGGDLRAVRWQGLTTPVDLNTRMVRPPAGLVLLAGAAINDDGTILAHSNAGLVMLRPGTRGTDAPVLGPVLGLPEVLEVGQDLALTVGFVDNAPWQTHKATVVWDDACASSPPTLREARGVGQVRLQHQLCAPGTYTVKVQVADSGGRSTEVAREIVVEVPGSASLSGKGTLSHSMTPAARGYRNVPLRFAMWAPLGNGRNGGNGAANRARSSGPVVALSGPFLFRSDQVTASTGSGQQARVEGTGRLNGRPGYRFVLEAYDGGASQGAGKDRLRVRVTHLDAVTGAETVDYDNGAQANARTAAWTDRTAVLEGGLRLRSR